MKVIVCRCTQCRGAKNKKKSKTKKRVKRYLNRLRRRADDGKVKTWCWA